MGAWGPAIYSDDTSCDLRDDYVAKLALGKSNEEATQEIMEEYYQEIKGTDEEPVFWFALALTQWKRGRLTDEVKEKALEYIENGSDLERWRDEGNKSNLVKRQKVLEELKNTLTQPMPEAKKVKMPSWVWKSPWDVGALLCYKIISERVRPEYLGKYVLARIIDIDSSFSNGIENQYIEIGIYGWMGDRPPETDITNNLEFMPLYEDKYDGHIYWSYETTVRKREIKERELICLGYDKTYTPGNKPSVFKGFVQYYILETIDDIIEDAYDNYVKRNHRDDS